MKYTCVCTEIAVSLLLDVKVSFFMIENWVQGPLFQKLCVSPQLFHKMFPFCFQEKEGCVHVL